MNNGISIYIGLDNTEEENIQLIRLASSLGITRIFTSFQIPETDNNRFKNEVCSTLKLAREFKMDVISDISPATLELLNMDKLDIVKLANMGVTTFRLDDGFSPQEIGEFSKKINALTNEFTASFNQKIRLQFNASTLNEHFIHDINDAKADLSCIDALHNFYPRKETGLSEEFFIKKNKLLKKFGINICAFVPSFNRPRSPIKDGLPTLEIHRSASFSFAVRHMQAMGVDSIFIGDSLPSKQELMELAKVKKNIITLQLKILTRDSKLIELLHNTFTTRLDDARDVFRTQESRKHAKALDIAPNNTIHRKKGAITIDNNLYGRYKGELQIVKHNLPADERVNVIAKLSKEEMKLLKYLTPGTQFSFKFM